MADRNYCLVQYLCCFGCYFLWWAIFQKSHSSNKCLLAVTSSLVLVFWMSDFLKLSLSLILCIKKFLLIFKKIKRKYMYIVEEMFSYVSRIINSWNSISLSLCKQLLVCWKCFTLGWILMTMCFCVFSLLLQLCTVLWSEVNKRHRNMGLLWSICIELQLLP